MNLTVSNSAVRDWYLFDQVEPIGPRELRMQLATLAAMFANAHRDPKASQPAKPDDFLLVHPGTLEEQRQERTGQMLDILRAIAKPGKPQRKRKGPPK